MNEATILDQLARLRDNESLTIGSAERSDVVVALSGVDPRHAQITRRDSALFIRDLDSHSGTFVNDQEARGHVLLHPGDRLRIGPLELTISVSLAKTKPRAGAVHGMSIVVADAIKRVSLGDSQSRAILDGVGFQIRPGEFVGVLGTSGSGKSTLIKAITGIVTLSGGTVLANGRPIPPAPDNGNRQVAYLPQDVVIHEALTPAVALDYIAQLKGLGESPADRQELVRSALGRVGVAERASVAIHRLSGGQRKRVALAAELLGDPQLILLDEATSGLDPATEGDMMALFRSLADEGRTVICITHFPGQLHLCDRLLYLMQGRLIFNGAPEHLKSFFAVENIEDAYSKQTEKSAAEWERLFGDSRTERASDRPALISHEESLEKAPSFDALVRQTQILTARYLRLQLADPKNLLLLFAQPPIIALMVAATFGSIKVSFAELHAADTKQVAFVLVLAVLWCSGTISVREIVKELPILRHEKQFGVQIVPYLCSKAILLGAFALTQTWILLAMIRHFTELTGPFAGHFLSLGLTSLAGVALGLLVSALAGTSERAMTILPVLLIGQAILSGGLARLTGTVRWFSMLLVPAYWSLDGLKSQFSSDLAHATYPGAPGHFQPPIMGPGGPLALDALVLVVQTAALLTGAYVATKFKATGSDT